MFDFLVRPFLPRNKARSPSRRWKNPSKNCLFPRRSRPSPSTSDTSRSARSKKKCRPPSEKSKRNTSSSTSPSSIAYPLPYADLRHRRRKARDRPRRTEGRLEVPHRRRGQIGEQQPLGPEDRELLEQVPLGIRSHPREHGKRGRAIAQRHREHQRSR